MTCGHRASTPIMNTQPPRLRPLSFALSVLLTGTVSAEQIGISGDRIVLPTVEVRAQAKHAADSKAPPDLIDGIVIGGKKATRIELSEQPAIVDNNYRQLLARLPGLMISEQPIPSHHNVNYRGLGDPHESEFVLFTVDGINVMGDWFGYSTLYFTPPAQRIQSIDFIRGGSGLMHGPQPGPVIDFVLRRPETGAPDRRRLDAQIGSDGFSGVYAELAGGEGRFGWLFDAYQNRSDGQRRNSAYEVQGGSAALLFQPDPNQSWDFNVSVFRSESQEPGRLSLAQFQADPMQTTTPTNLIWIDRAQVDIHYQRALGDNSQLTAKLWHSYMGRFSRRATNTAPGAPLPAFTTFDNHRYHNTSADARLLTEWGSDHSLVVGATAYVGDSPRSQKRSTNLFAEEGDTLRFAQQRDNTYVALFAENIFRVGDWTLVPALRQERLVMRIEEPVKLASLRRPALDRAFIRNKTLLGFGASRELGENWRAYGNASQGYRPMRYDDIGNPALELAGLNNPELGHSENFEIGLRGSPVNGVFVDVSLFRVDLNDKIERRLLPGTMDFEHINSGDARHQGLEFAVDWNVLANSATGDALTLFVNGSLLDAEIVRTTLPGFLGNTPQSAPERILRAGLLWQGAAGQRAALTGKHVSEQFWRDDNRGTGVGAARLPATMDAYTVWDLSAEWPLGESVTVLGGVTNIADEIFSSRIRTDGIDVAPRRASYLGLRLTF